MYIYMQHIPQDMLVLSCSKTSNAALPPQAIRLESELPAQAAAQAAGPVPRCPVSWGWGG